MRNIDWFAVIFITALVAIAPSTLVLSSEESETSALLTSAVSEDFVTQLITLANRQRVPPRTPISRGGLCVVSPGVSEERLSVWSDRPLFIWRGEGHTLRVLDRSSDRVLWEQRLPATARLMAYAGTPLQTGESYDWQLLPENPSESDLNFSDTFQIMPSGEERNQIDNALETLETELHAAGASAAAIAQRKALYLVERGLWSDTLQMLYSVPNPSADIRGAIDWLVNQICPAAEG